MFMGGVSVMEWIVAQQTPLGSNPATDSQTAGSIPELVIILIILLMIATAVALITQRLRIPYVTGLVLAGLPITELLSRRIGLDPSLVLNLFLPILIFEAAINTDISRLRSTFKPIALLAGPGSVFSSAIIAVLVKFGLGLPWIPALLIGARYGIIGVAVGHLVAILIRRVISLGLATRFVNVTILDIFGELRSSLIAALVMAPITFAVSYLTTDLNPFLQLIFIVFSGAMSYLGVLWWIEKENLMRLLRMVRVSQASA